MEARLRGGDFLPNKSESTDDVYGLSCIESYDLDHYRAQPGNWNVQASQLGSGVFSSKIRSIRLPGVVVYDNRWGAPCLIRGESPPGWLMMGAMVSPERAAVRWCGKEVDRRRFACTSQGRPIDFSTDQLAHDVILLITPDLLTKTAGAAAVELLHKSSHVNFGSAGGEIIDLTLGLIADCTSQSSLLDSPVVLNDMRSRILRTVEKCFFSALPAGAIDPMSLREEAVHCAISHVAGTANPVSAWDMAQAAGVSQKTLECAFKEILGMTPGQYLNVNRLNKAHKRLAASSSADTTVTAVALEHGFSHAGRFSRAYRALFDELPSATLSR